MRTSGAVAASPRRRRKAVPRPYAPSGSGKPIFVVAWSDTLVANVPANLAGYGAISTNGQELHRLAAWRAQNPDLLCLVYINMSFTKTYEYQMDYGAGNPMVQPWSWLKYPTCGVPYGQAIGDGGPVREDWFIHGYGTAGTAADRLTSAHFPQAYLMNVGVVSYQDQWAANVIRFCQEWGFDGVMADDCNPDIANHLNRATECSLEWPNRGDSAPAFQSMLANVGPKFAAKGLHLVPNVADAWRIGDATMQAQWCPHVAGFLFEHIMMGSNDTDYINTNAQITHLQYVRNCQVTGKYALTVGYHPSTDKKAMRCARAGLELVRDQARRTAGSFVARSQTEVEENTTSSYFEWTLPLGDPVAAEQTVGANGVQAARTRRLANGFVAINPVGGTAQTITCPIAGTRVSSGAAIAAGATFTLQPDDAEIVYF